MGRLGEWVWAQWDELRHTAAVIGTVLGTCAQPRYWVRTVRKAFALQVLSIGVEPLWFVGAVAVFVGISVVVQLSFWVGEAGQSQLLGPLLVAVVARELGPVLINLVVIVRSGSAMTTELGVLKINGEVRALETQGSDPFLQLVMPRVLGTAVSTFCLTVFLSWLPSRAVTCLRPGRGKAAVICFCLPTPCRARFNPRTFLTSLPKASCPPCLPARPVASADWVSAGPSRKSRRPRNGRSPAPSPDCLSSPPPYRC